MKILHAMRVFSGFFLLASVSLSYSQIITNGSFELPKIPAATFQYPNASSGWIFSGDAGITSRSGPFTDKTPEAPSGSQVAFLQRTGQLSQSIQLRSNAIITFSATQRINYNDLIQSLSVYVDGIPQVFMLGAPGGRVSTTKITPPRDYYSTYSLKIQFEPSKVNEFVELKIVGNSPNGDATVFIDSIAMSTPNAPAFGLWDPDFNLATWRSDYEYPTKQISAGPCLYQGNIDNVVQAGATPDGQGSACLGIDPSSPYPDYNASNWSASEAYTQGSPHWLSGVNYEYLDIPVNTPDSGPPNQSRALVSPYDYGPVLSVNKLNSVSDPEIGNRNVISLMYKESESDRDYAIPYVSFGVHAVHGNQMPIAVLDADGFYRSHLKFSASAFLNQEMPFSYSWLILKTNGWSDNVDRLLYIEIMPKSENTPDDQYMYKKSWWNWNIKNSAYYPGGLLSYWKASKLNQVCGVNIPTLSSSNTYVGSGHSPSSIFHYDLDLYKIIACVAANGGWGGNFKQLPDPLVINQVEWSVEAFLIDPAKKKGHVWAAFWNPRIE